MSIAKPLKHIIASGFLLCLLLVAFHAPRADAEGHAQSIDKVPAATDTEFGRKSFEYGIEGKPKPDGLGEKLPDGFTRELIIKQLAPDADPERITLVGAKAWPLRPNTYVAVVALARMTTISSVGRG